MFLYTAQLLKHFNKYIIYTYITRDQPKFKNAWIMVWGIPKGMTVSRNIQIGI